MRDGARARDGALVSVKPDPAPERVAWRFDWLVWQWSEEACAFARKALERRFGYTMVRDGRVWRPLAEVVTSDAFAKLGMKPEVELAVPGNLLVNEGIQRLLDLLIAAGGTAYNNANAYLGVGDSSAAEAATQTELQAATNRFYKAMVASYPQRTAQTVDWRSDFTTSEANYAWNEWSCAAGATTASGSGFTTGTTNLNRKVQSLGTKASGTWTLTGSVTIS